MRSVVSALVMATALLATPVMADEDHGLGKIVTEELDLSYIDHVLAGRVGDRSVYALPLANEFGMRLLHRAGGQDFETEFRAQTTDNGTEYVANLASMTLDGEQSETLFRVTSVSAADGEIKGFLNDKPFTVRVSSDEMAGNHYIDPLFEIDVNGVPYSFVLEDGQACIGCALKISFAVISMLGAYGTL